MTKYFTKFIMLIICLSTCITSSFAADEKIHRINLSAHIIDNSVANLKETQWSIFFSKKAENSDGQSSKTQSELREQFKGANKSLELPAGTYVIKAEYGHAIALKTVQLADDNVNNLKNVKMVFNLAGLKLSSSIGTNGQKIDQNVNYIIRNKATKKIEFETNDTTNIHYLNQGDYSITAKYADFSVSDADITLLANNLNLVNFNHKLGQVILNIDEIKSEIKAIPPTWRILEKNGKIDREVTTLDNQNILLPIGEYQAIVEWNDVIYRSQFALKSASQISLSIPK